MNNVSLNKSLLLASKCFLLLVIIGFFLPFVGNSKNHHMVNGFGACKVNNAINEENDQTIDVTKEIRDLLTSVSTEDYGAIIFNKFGTTKVRTNEVNKREIVIASDVKSSIEICDKIAEILSSNVSAIKADGNANIKAVEDKYDSLMKSADKNSEDYKKLNEQRKKELSDAKRLAKIRVNKFNDVVAQTKQIKTTLKLLETVPQETAAEFKRLKSGLNSSLLFGIFIVAILSLLASVYYFIKKIRNQYSKKKEPAGLNVDFTIIMLLLTLLLSVRISSMTKALDFGIGLYLVIAGMVISLILSVLNVVFTPKNQKKEPVDAVLDHLIVIVLTFIVIVTVYPFWNTIAVSFNDGLDSIKGGISLWPRKFTWDNYKSLFITDSIAKAFTVSVTRTILQTVFSVFCTCMLAYALSRKEFILKKSLTTIIVISMYVNAGVIPGYLLIKNLKLLDNYLVYIIPCLVDVFNFILVRTYINALPDSFVESARIDGANEFKIFMSIIFPLIVPSVAMICLFVAVGAWNSWFDTYLFITKNHKLDSLQYVLMSFLNSSQSQSKSAADAGAAALSAAGGAAASQVTPVAIRASITMIATVPILVVYPFVQKYFVVGMTIGGVKE